MSLAEATRALTGQEILFVQTLQGGDLSQVARITLAPDHITYVAKTGPRVACEARMLAALAQAGSPVPDVIGVSGDVLLMEDLPEGPATPDAWAGLGMALKAQHKVVGAAYGWVEPYAFGPVAIPCAPRATWPGFWADQRLMAAPGEMPRAIAKRLERLSARLPDLLPPAPPASLLHGDLWRGNVHFSGGKGNFIDPACYHGHGEVDLAMLHLFGAPPPEFQDAYGPLDAGAAERRPIYQLWPALVHLRLFGAGYRGLVENLLDRCGV